MRHGFLLCFLFIMGCSEGQQNQVPPDQKPREVVAQPDPPAPKVENREIEELAKVRPAPAGPAIPQDAAKTAKRNRERLEWHLRNSLGIYDKVGKKDPRWDDLARKAIDLAIHQSFDSESEISFSEVNGAAKAAVDAGCDDPLVAMVYVQSSHAPDESAREKRLTILRGATKAYAASPYPAFRRAGAFEGLAGELMRGDLTDEAVTKEVEANLDASLSLLAEGAISDERNGFWVDKMHNTVIYVIKDFRKLGMAPEAAYERADAKMVNIPGLEVVRQMVRGSFWLTYGWDARTKALAPDVPEGGFQSLEERLGAAKKAFEEAWKLRPDSEFVAQRLMEIDKAIGGDRAVMEKWFERAMEVNSDYLDACSSKLDWLDPKWHGTPEEMLAFGIQCRDTKNSRSGITLLIADAHWRIACMLGADQNRYLASPEVWADIKSVYEEYLKLHPEDDVARCKFATFSHLSGHYREAEVQYVALGDRLAAWTDFPYVPLGQLKQNRERNASILMGREGRTSFPGWHFVRAGGDSGSWFVNIPVGAPAQKKPGILGANHSYLWTCSADGITYGIRALQLPADLRKEEPARVLDAARSVVAKELGAEPLNVREAMLAARTGEEYDVEAPGLKPRQVRVKTIVIGSWLCELSVTGNKGDLTGAAPREFFDSFAYQSK